MHRRYGLAALTSYAALLAALAALIVAILTSLGDAQRLFDSAAEAQRQIAIVSRIQTLAAAGPVSHAALDDALSRYRRSIAVEGEALGASSRDRQAVEMRNADRIADLARRDPAALARLVGTIAAREQDEATVLAEQMTSLRHRVGWLVALLAVAAALAAGLGAAGLLTANRRLAREVAARTADLAAIDRSRRLFFAKASHELRSPVTVMRGEAEVALANAGADTISLRGALGHVIASTDFLEHRIGELLGLAQAEDGKISLAFATIDPSVIAGDAVATARSYADSAGVAIALDPAEGLAVAGDARWLGQAMLAVIDNAVKFSPGGGTVRISVSRQADAATVTIADRGIGVSTAELPQIFDAYYQADAGTQRGGTGLGLALARWVVEQHRGTIGAANDPDGGCIITMTLPVAA